MTLRRMVSALSPWRYRPVIYTDGSLARWERVAAPWVRRAPWLLAYIAAAVVGLLLGALLFPMPAGAQEPWRGSMEWRGETIDLRSCCGPLREPVIRRELEAGYARARADLDASGHQHVALPHLGTPEAPYTIEIARDPGCPGGAQGCSRTVHPEQRWTLAIMRDKAAKRAAPVNHELQHRYCLLVRPFVVPPRSVAELRGLTAACELADHPVSKAYRFDVAGRVAPVRKGKP